MNVTLLKMFIVKNNKKMKLQLSFKKDKKITSIETDSFDKVNIIIKEYTKQGYSYQGIETRPK